MEGLLAVFVEVRSLRIARQVAYYPKPVFGAFPRVVGRPALDLGARLTLDSHGKTVEQRRVDERGQPLDLRPQLGFAGRHPAVV